MRRLLSTRTNKSFTVLKDMISNKVQEIGKHERNFGIEFEKQLKQMILDKRNQQQKIRKMTKKYTKMCMTSGKPVQTLLKEFLDHAKKYNEEDLVEATQYIGKAFQMGIMDHGGHLDRSGYKLIQSPMFDHFIEQIKYALSSRAYIQIPNISKILNSLIKLNYLDNEILNLALLRLQKDLNLKNPIEFTPREYQIEKKGYYNENIIGFDKQILKNEKILENFEYYEKKRLSFANTITFDQVKKEDFQSQENYQVVVELVEKFQKFNHGVEQLVEGVIAVRQQYRKLVTISENQKVMRHPELNNSALYIEERLLEMHLITYEDVQNPQQILNKQKQLKKVESIVKIIMSEADVDNFEDFLVKEGKNLQYLEIKKQKRFAQYCQLLEAAAKYANSPYRLNGNDTKVTLLNTKWQRELIGDNFSENNIKADRIFRKSYVNTQKFLSTNMQLLQSYLSPSTFLSKLHYYSALIELGFYEELSTELKNTKVVPEMVQKMEISEFLIFVKVLNNEIGALGDFYHLVQKRLDTILENGDYCLSIDQVCVCVNYLYQARSAKQYKQGSVYRRLVLLLSEMVKGMEYNGAINPWVYKQAKRILCFQCASRPSNLHSLSQLQSLSSTPPQNPITQTLYLSLHPNPSTTPYIPLSISSQNQLTCLYIADSSNSSLNGTSVSGNIKAYTQRLSEKYNIHCIAVPVTKFISLEWKQREGQGQEGQVEEPVLRVKNSGEIVKAIAQMQGEGLNFVADSVRKIAELVAKVDDGVRTAGVLHRLKRIAGLFANQRKSVLIDQFYAKRLQLIFQLQLLKRDTKLLNKETLASLQQSQPQSDSLSNLLSQLQRQLTNPLQKIQSRYKQMCKKAGRPQKVFKGKRISVDLLDSEKNMETVIPGSALISLPFTLDTTYIQYPDWEEKVKKSIGYYEIQVQNLSQISRLLIKKYCPHIKEKIVTLPSVDNEVLVPYFPVNWESKYLYHVENKGEKDQIEKIAEEFRGMSGKQVDWDVQAIVGLQNFKHQLKLTKTPQQIAQLILNLEFIDTLIQQKLSSSPMVENPKLKFLPRCSTSQSQVQSHLQSPFLSYINKKHQKKQYLKEQLEVRNDKKRQLQQKHKIGEISSKQLRNKLQQIDKQLIKVFQNQLKKKGLDHVHHVRVLDEGAKIVQLWGQIQGVLDQEDQDDMDQLMANSQEQLVRMRRSRAETNLILARIIYLQHSNKQLSQPQKSFLASHKAFLQQSLESPCSSPTQNFTTKSLQQISANDKRRLKLKHNSIIENCPNLALSDFIVELSQFIDQKVIKNLEIQVFKQKVAEKYGFSKEVFGGFRTSEMGALTAKMQENIFDQASKLTQRQIECIVDMSKIFKTQGFSDRKKYNIHYPNLQQTLQTLNKSPLRNPLVSAYLHQKDSEYYLQYSPQLVSKQKQKQVFSLWKKIFNTEYQHTKPSQISNKINQICRSMLFLKLNQPPYFGSFLFELIRNPKTDVYSKEKLIAFCELFKIQIKLDSNQILEIGKDSKILEADKIWDSLRALGRKGQIMSLL